MKDLYMLFKAVIVAALLVSTAFVTIYIRDNQCMEAQERWETYVPVRQAYCWLREGVNSEQHQNLP